jgi:hypothetical protein
MESVDYGIPKWEWLFLKQSVRTCGFEQTLNLAGTPLDGLIDCFAINLFH